MNSKANRYDGGTALKYLQPVASVAQRYHVTSDTLGREFDPGKRDFLTEKLKNENKNAQRVEND